MVIRKVDVKDQVLVQNSTSNSTYPHTLKSFIGSIISILIRMRQQTQFPVRLFDLIVRRSLLQAENLVESRCRALPHPYDCSLLLDGVLAILVPLIVVARVCGPIWRWFHSGGGCGGHGDRRVRGARPRKGARKTQGMTVLGDVSLNGDWGIAGVTLRAADFLLDGFKPKSDQRGVLKFGRRASCPEVQLKETPMDLDPR